MAQFVFSAFADEISPNFDEQLSGLQKLGIGMIELRGVDGKSFTALTDGEVEAVKHKLENAGIGISALGTPIGKIKLDGDMEAHEKLLERIMDIGDMLGCKRLRVFSFYPADGMSGDEFRAGAFEAVGRMLALAEARGFTLCHENEKDIYGETPERELELLSHFGGRLKAVLDPGNFAFCRLDAAKGYPMLKDYIEYFHIKDADEEGTIVPPGCGVAHLAETLAAVNADRTGKVILTIEPHLMDFTGLASLAAETLKHKYTFETPFDAFRTAAELVMRMAESLE